MTGDQGKGLGYRGAGKKNYLTNLSQDTKKP